MEKIGNLIAGIIVCGLFFCTSALADVLRIEGVVIYQTTHERRVNDKKIIHHRLRIKKLKIESQGDIPLVFSAVLDTEADSFLNEIISESRKKRTPCLFILSSQGNQYRIHAAYLLKGGSFGRTVSPSSPGSKIVLEGNVVYRNLDTKVIINQRQSVEKSIDSGGSGISIGN